MNLFILFLFAAFSWAGPKCTDQAKENWQDQDTFKKTLIDKGYKIKKFKVTSGDCYEIYGWNKNQEKVEIYFNPVTSEIVKTKKW